MRRLSAIAAPLPRVPRSRLSAAAPRRFLRCAQPTPPTHPHLLSTGEVTPGLSANEFAARRAKFAELLPPHTMALFPAAPRAYMSHDVPFPHHQDTDLLYLSGLQEHSSLLACVKPSADSAAARWHLFVRPSSPAEEMWDGPRAGVAGAQSFFLSEGETHALGDASSVLAAELNSSSSSSSGSSSGGPGSTKPMQLMYAADRNPTIHAALRSTLIGAAQARGRPGIDAHTAHRLVHRMRVHKSDAEIELMRRSGAVGADSMRSTMHASTRAAARGMTEAALAATFEFEIRLHGAERLAYPCVVAGGENAVTLHYMHNNCVMDQQSLLLMDAGSSLHGYCSDVTRTWPLGGKFSEGQAALYEAVLDVNERIIDACVADGRTSLNTLHRMSLQLMYEHLLRLGILQRDDPHAARKCQTYYPHAIGHWLGLDVHDTPSVESSVPLEPNMVVTVEPGLYIPADDESAPAWARGIGIRIEDDVLIKDAGGPPEVLTRGAPKRVDEIEALLASEM